MGAFTPFKKHANKFNYIPRYYDPAKEAREQRRAEMYGERSDQQSNDASYRPGQYIRTSRDARSARLSRERNAGANRKARMWIMIGALIAITYMGSMLYNKLVEMFVPSEGNAPKTEVVEEFNTYAPITIVPNDYVEE